MTDKSEELYRILKERGFEEGFCKELAYKYLNTDYTATRMLGYLYRMEQTSIEMVVDEMLAILSDRDHLTKKYESEQAQAKISEIYRYGLDGIDLEN